MRTAEGLLCGRRKHRDVDRVARTEIRDKLIAEYGTGAVRLVELHIVEMPSDRVPYRRSSGLVLIAAQFSDHSFAEPIAVGGDEHVARARHQLTQRKTATFRVDEQAADLRFPVEIVGEVEQPLRP
nr:hypothetical protein [Novosphingobium sp. Gsoil 351]